MFTICTKKLYKTGRWNAATWLMNMHIVCLLCSLPTTTYVVYMYVC